jgi:hypothetical protein
MDCKYFTLGEVPVMFEPETERIYISAGDEWVEICDPDLLRLIRLETVEARYKEAMHTNERNFFLKT